MDKLLNMEKGCKVKDSLGSFIVVFVLILAITGMVKIVKRSNSLVEFTANRGGTKLSIKRSEIRTVYQQPNQIIDGKVTVLGQTAITVDNNNVYEVRESYDETMEKLK